MSVLIAGIALLLFGLLGWYMTRPEEPQESSKDSGAGDSVRKTS